MTEEQTTTPASSENTNAPITKIFVGNLSFRTRGPGLREAFEAAGKVEGVRVVTQGRRSMGYGFVQFATLEEAKKAVELLHKKPLDGREINVEVSTSSNTGLNPVKRRRPRTRKPKKDSGETETPNGDAAPAATPTGDDTPKKKARRTRKSPKKRSAATEATTEGSPAPADGTAPVTKTRAPRKPRAPREPREVNEPRAPRAPRAPREAREPREPREFSDTILYVSNIPFSFDNEGLIEAFKEFAPTSANIIRRNRTNLSKGFGFVEFADAAKQQAALDAKHRSKLADREITVRKAHIRPPADESASTANATTSESVEAKAE